MKSSVALARGAAVILLAGLVLQPGDARASGGEGGDSDHEAGKRVERKLLVHRGHGRGSFLGVRLEDVEAGEGRGAVVRSVEQDSPAENAGLQEGDVIVRFDGESVRSAAQLARLVRETPAGRSVPVEVRRDGSSRTVTATLEEGSPNWWQGNEDHLIVPDRDFDITVPEPFPPHRLGSPGVGPGPYVFRWRGPGDGRFATPWLATGPPRLGIRYMEIGGQLAEYFGLEKDEGVLVTSVDEDSPAAKAGVKAGDVILEFDGEAVDGGNDLRARVAEAEGGEIALKVKRHGKPLDLKVTLADKARRPEAGGVDL